MASSSPAAADHGTASSTASPTVTPSSAVPVEEDLRALSESCPFNRLQLLKIGFFCGSFASAVIGAFGSLLLHAKGLSPTVIGLIFAVNPVCKFFLLPYLSVFAETRNLQIPMMFAGMAIGGVMLTVLLFASQAWVIVAAILAYLVSFVHVFPFLDEYSLAVLGPARRESWGSYRSYGAYGWATSAIVTSLTFGYVGWNYVLVEWCAGFGLLALTIVQAPVTKVVGDHSYTDVVRHVWSSPRIMNFFFGAACMGCGGSMVGSFLFPYLSQHLDPSPLLYGLCLVFTVSIEIPLFRSSAWLHARFTDRQLLLTAMFAWCVRVTGYSLLTNPWYVLILEPLHGLTFGLTWLSGMHFFTGQFPATQSNSAVGLLHASADGIGALCGNLFSGILFDTVGPQRMFQLGAAGMLVAALTFYHLEHRLEADLIGGEEGETTAVMGDEQADGV